MTIIMTENLAETMPHSTVATVQCCFNVFRHAHGKHLMASQTMLSSEGRQIGNVVKGILQTYSPRLAVNPGSSI